MREGKVADFKNGERVLIKSLTDVDTKEPEPHDELGIIGRSAIVVQAGINDYYDCVIQLEEPLGELGDLLRGYGSPPELAMLYCDLEHA